MANISIFQAFHKPYPHNNRCDWIKPIGVSGYKEEGFLSDAEGENISKLNPYYCELTAMYWAWKNHTSDYIGLYHYRRYMSYLPDNVMTSKENYIEVNPNETNINYLTQEAQLASLKNKLDLFDVVIPRSLPQVPSMQLLYMQLHQQKPWIAFIDAIRQKYPHHSRELKYFEKNTETTVYNMFVMKEAIFKAYCKDLFEIIDQVYTAVGAPYDPWNNRYPGFLAERFLGFWLYLKNIRPTTAPVVFLN